MAGSVLVKGIGRKILYSNLNLSVTGSNGVDLATVRSDQYAEFSGLVSVIGSATFQWQMGVGSGSYQVTSATTINSGSITLDQNLYGSYINFGFTQAASQAGIVIAIHGKPMS